MANKTREIWECEKCNTKQAINNQAHRTVKCLNCEHAYAIVVTPEGEKAMVPYYNQGSRA